MASCNNCYVNRVKGEKKAKKEGDNFDAKKEAYKPSEQRKTDQVTVDTQVRLSVIYWPVVEICVKPKMLYKC